MTARSKARRDEILSLVESTGEVTVEEVAGRFGTSLETIRRDLTILEDAGALLKIHGGAKRLPNSFEGSFHERMGQNREGKRAISEKLSAWLEPNQTIFMDTGSTTLIAAERLTGAQSLQVITNSLKIAGLLASRENGPKVFLLGGFVEGSNGETVGTTPIETIGRFNADVAVITVGALNQQDGACDFDFDEAQIARAMTERASRTVVLADQSKFGRRAVYTIRQLADIDVLISDAMPAGALGSAISKAGVHVI